MSERTGRQCAFCGAGGKMDKEHVLSNWLAGELPDMGKGRHQRIGAFGENRGEWRDEAFTVRVGAICPACNQGWMSDLEGKVKRWLKPMLHGRGRTYYREGMTVLATWAAKTALVMASRASEMPRAPYEFLFHERVPSPTTRIWLGAFDLGAYRTYRTFVPVNVNGGGSPPLETNAYVVTVTAGPALFHVFGNESGRRSDYGLEGRLAQSLLQIWPLPDQPVTWPPPSLEPADLDELANAHGHVLPVSPRRRPVRRLGR